jgi:hypothetical protein
VLDAYNRRIVDWAMGRICAPGLCLTALETAIGERKPMNVINQSDQGTQFQ